MTAIRAAFLWGVTLLIWADAALFWRRVHTPFHDFLFKAPRLWIVLALLVILPGIALWSGVGTVRRKRTAAGAWANAAGGAVAIAAFVVIIGVPMLKQRMADPPPKNPSSPRPVLAPAGLPVFPGAEGFGTRTRAGRGGKLIAVTSLADEGPGSLRAALADSNPRTIVFRVAGIIALTKPLRIAAPFVTVAGQTAPGDGICIAGAGLVIATHDVLIQHIRIRPGSEGPIAPEDNDAIAILGKFGSDDGAHHVVIDHVSASWSEDELVSTWYGAHDVTISSSIMSEALNRSRHRKYTHSAGLLIGNSSDHVSVHNNLFAHNDFRNPLIIDGGTHDVVNNVMYDWGVLPAEIVDSDSNSFLNFVGNTFIAGPSTNPGPFEILINHDRRSSVPKLYVRDNVGPHRPDDRTDVWSIVGFNFGQGIAPALYRSADPFPVYPISAERAAVAFARVLDQAGATRPGRDAVDRRIVEDVRTRKGAIIDSPRDVGGHPAYRSGPAPADSDDDGVPDEWEVRMKLDPNDASDANGDQDGDGYTNLEEYLHAV